MHNPPPPTPQGDTACWQSGEIYVVPNANQDLIETTPFIADYPATSIDLQYHFARLHPNSLSSCGASTAPLNNLSPLIKDYATLTINSSASVLPVGLEESSI